MANEGRSQGQRTFTTRQRLDKSIDPPAYVDEELPTVTRNLLVLRRGRVRAPRGTIVGSIYLTGSWRPFTPGSYSLRVLRVSVATGSRNMEWFIRHSRSGTYDILSFPTPGQQITVGGPLNPVYAFGPGTVLWGWLGDSGGAMGTAYYTSQHLEGIIQDWQSAS